MKYIYFSNKFCIPLGKFNILLLKCLERLLLGMSECIYWMKDRKGVGTLSMFIEHKLGNLWDKEDRFWLKWGEEGRGMIASKCYYVKKGQIGKTCSAILIVNK